MSPSTVRPAAVDAWHEVVRTGDLERLQALLADAVVFRSPAVHTPQEGRATTTLYLRAALEVLGPRLTYHRQLWDEGSAVLEFTTVTDCIWLNCNCCIKHFKLLIDHCFCCWTNEVNLCIHLLSLCLSALLYCLPKLVCFAL